MSDPIESEGNEEVSPIADAATPGTKSADNVIKPSTEKEQGEEVKAPPELKDEEEPSHEAVGLGVLDADGRPNQADQ